LVSQSVCAAGEVAVAEVAAPGVSLRDGLQFFSRFRKMAVNLLGQ
jgi:hypothetical protein